MCEVTTKRGAKCVRKSRFYVNVKTIPQRLGKNGEYGMEGQDAGRSLCACHQHIGSAVMDLSSLPIRRAGALPTVVVLQ